MNTERIFQSIDKDKLAKSLWNIFYKIKKTNLETFFIYHVSEPELSWILIVK